MTPLPRIAALVALLALLLGPPARAGVCGDDGDLLFACETDRAGKSIYICGYHDDSGKGWSGAQYLFGKEGAPELTYPQQAEEAKQRLFFSHHWKGPEYDYVIRFVSGSYTYRLEGAQRIKDSVMNPDNVDVAGITVTDKAGKRVARIDCAERPSAYTDDLRQALGCDMTTPNGAAACAEKAPKVK